MHMRTTLILDDDLLERARSLTGLKKTAMVHAGLEALIARESARPGGVRREGRLVDPRGYIRLGRTPAEWQRAASRPPQRWARSRSSFRRRRAGARPVEAPFRNPRPSGGVAAGGSGESRRGHRVRR